jgi:hypothetical protein
MKILRANPFSVFLIISMLIISGCGKSAEVMSAEFSSMDSCLSSIKRNYGGKLNIISDELGEISGKLSNGEDFACKTKTSGTKGVYVEGWFTIKE